MIDISIDKIISKIIEEKSISEDEIKAKIKAKLEQLSGLISEEGAAHIVAKELGVNLIAISTGFLKINELKPGMKSANVLGKVTRKFDIREFEKGDRKGKVASFFIGDETGQVKITLWNDQADQLNDINVDDVVKITNAFVKENRGFNEVHLANSSKLKLNPEGVDIKVREKSVSREYPSAERKTISELKGGENNVELLATIVQVYDPRFFEVCPECNKRVTQEGDEYKCAEHGKVTPLNNYVISAFLDDGTGNIRATFWKAQSQHLTSKTDNELLKIKYDPQEFEKIRTELLGEIIKVKGNVKNNEAFERLDFTAYIVERNVDPTEELEKLGEEKEEAVEKPEVKEEIKTKEVEKPKVEEKPAVIDDSKKASEELAIDNSVLKESEKKETQKERSDNEIHKQKVEEEIISLDDLDDL